MQNQNKSLSRGLKILKVILFSDKPLTAISLCQELDIDKSTMSRLITSLMNEGFIKYLNNSKEIIKADLMDSMTLKAKRVILVEQTQDLLEDIFNLTQECTYLAVRENNSLIYLNQVDNSTRVIKMRDTKGLLAPLHCTALGKILLAYDNIDISQINLTSYTKNTLTKIRFIKKELENIKKNHYAIGSEEYEYGLSSLAVGIFDKDKNLLACVGISGLSSRLDNNKLHEYSKAILKLCTKAINI